MAWRNLRELDDPIVKEILELLAPIQDPELGLSIVDLGLVYDIRYDLDKKALEVDVTLTTPACPWGDIMLNQIEDTLKGYKDFQNISVNLVWTPEYDPRIMAEDYIKEMIGLY
ncbi:MAG: metal-sulfur cluster assembly factor [bacterium]